MASFVKQLGWIKVILLIISISMVHMSLYSLNDVNKNTDSIVKDKFPILKNIHKLQMDVYNANQHLRDAAMMKDVNEAKLELDKMLITRASATKVYEFLEANKENLEPEVKKLLKMIIEDRPVYRKAQLEVIDFILKGDREGTEKALLKFTPLQQQYYERVSAMVNIIHQDIYKTNKSNSTVMSMLYFAVAIITTALLFKNNYKL